MLTESRVFWGVDELQCANVSKNAPIFLSPLGNVKWWKVMISYGRYTTSSPFF